MMILMAQQHKFNFSLKRLIIILAIIILTLQLLAKYYFGLGELPLYVINKNYEYIYAPNQNLYRFHNHIVTNEKSMRSKPISKNDKIRILKFGDSVINGGAHVDQDNLASTLLENNLQLEFNDSIRVLNISAQSWGPDNAFAYLNENGNFDAKFFILVFSSHDLHDNMHFKNVVGNHQAWPNQQPLCAFTDAFNRYLIPKVKSWFGAKSEEYDYLFDFDDSKRNPGWKLFFNYCNKNNIKLLVYLHATTDEIKNNAYDKYGNQIIAMLDSNQVEYIKGLDYIKSTEAYRDKIHLNANGHKLLNKALYPHLQAYCKELRSHE